ncbi:uncharacterized protein J3D65DRAFT_206524 [Phyllosticta citribraziliensis]|uniref:Uncharacterized protein n=1 Tax=Phyllosticta citribraziliensis TaxID=989973 RepID=A0ABR1M6U4_9PEZI
MMSFWIVLTTSTRLCPYSGIPEPRHPRTRVPGILGSRILAKVACGNCGQPQAHILMRRRPVDVFRVKRVDIRLEERRGQAVQESGRRSSVALCSCSASWVASGLRTLGNVGVASIGVGGRLLLDGSMGGSSYFGSFSLSLSPPPPPPPPPLFLPLPEVPHSPEPPPESEPAPAWLQPQLCVGPRNPGALRVQAPRTRLLPLLPLLVSN